MRKIIYDSEDNLEISDELRRAAIAEHLRRAREKRTAKRAEASRRNGQLGGRPKGIPNRCPDCGGGWTSKVHKDCKLAKSQEKK